jgi:hypothetical protein
VVQQRCIHGVSSNGLKQPMGEGFPPALVKK